MDEIDPVIHQPVRLRLMAALMALDHDAEVDFVYLRDRLELTDGNLSVHLSRLEEARYLKQIKTFERRKPRTYIRLTPRGRAAFAEHVAALEEILRPGSTNNRS